MSDALFRRECFRCHKAAVVCICGDVPRVENRTGVVILQHPRERFHPIGTVRFAKLGLANVKVIVDGASDPTASLPNELGLLYPAPGARLLSEVPAAERPANLLILDGTWSQARVVYRKNRWLARLPHYALAPKEKGRYRIRLEPDDRSLSTIEAIVEALELLEPDTAGTREMLAAFTRMIDTQIDYARTPHPRIRRTREVESRAIPAVLTRTPERIVLGHGEFALPPEGPGRGKYSLVYWCALRLDTGETFEAFVQPRHFPSDRQLGHMRLSREEIAGGCSLEDFERRWRKFIGDRVLATWNKSTIDFLSAELALDHEMIALKSVYCNARKRHCGSLDAVLAAEALEPMPAPFPGRPGEMMSQLRPIALALARPRLGP